MIGVCLSGDVDFDLNEVTKKYQISYWIAVDGGYNHLISHGIKPSILIGDLDSIQKKPTEINVLKYDCEKDETDFELTINYLNRYFPNQKIIVTGVYSNERLEHFVSNLKLMTSKMTYLTKYNEIRQYNPGEYQIKSNSKKFSIFAKEKISDLTIKKAKWELENYPLDVNNPLGISNEFLNEAIAVKFTTGLMQVFLNHKLK